jgi:hypothetical protein
VPDHEIGLYAARTGTEASLPRFSTWTGVCNDAHFLGALAALVLGTIPANAQLMNEGSQIIAMPGNPQLGEPGLGMSDVVKETGPPRTLFGYFRHDNGPARNRRIIRED